MATITVGRSVILPDQLGEGALDLRQALGNKRVAVKVVDKSRLGVCQLLLPMGVIIPHHSQLITEGQYAGYHFLDLSEQHIKEV